MGLARVLLGRGSKETRLDKCTRIDSLGLARRRLAAKAAQAELSADGGSLEGIGRDDDGVAAEPGLLEQDLQDAISLNFLGRRHKDSLRIHRRRFKMRASLDLPSSRLAEKNASWIVGELPSLSVEPDAQDENADDDNEDGNGDDDGDEPQNGRISCVVNTNHHVRFRLSPFTASLRHHVTSRLTYSCTANLRGSGRLNHHAGVLCLGPRPPPPQRRREWRRCLQ
ncbi:hypothetical protein Vretimale_11338 [Volvox reticuliferus]|uniref:Uncharacterized protein n=2 Tax=Volvox reticuliferus TaxID=1737510 RepID=A0A8J4LRE9_9CHLO|nr:hypothetical protein Vretimale_11338 [Volvox reticuliferus]